MGRAWAVILIVAMLTLSASPLASAPRPRNAMADSCPMMHLATAAPCIGAPCPCDHGSDGSLLPAGPLAAPVAAQQLTSPAPLATRHSAPRGEAAQAGFPRESERPPSAHA